MPTSSWKLSLLLLQLTEDLAVAAAHLMRYAPDVDRPDEAERANVNRWRIRPGDVATPLPAVTEDCEPADVDVDALRHVDVDVAEGHQNRDGRLRRVDLGLAEIEVDVREGADGTRPPS